MTDLLPPGAEPSDPLGDIDVVAIDPTIAEALARIAAGGYPGHFEVTRTHIWCASCRSTIATRDVRWRAIEIVTGPHGVSVVGGIRCPVCSERGTATTTLDLLDR